MYLPEKVVFEFLFKTVDVEENAELPQCTHIHAHKYAQHRHINTDYSRHVSILLGNNDCLPRRLSLKHCRVTEPPWGVGCCQIAQASAWQGCWHELFTETLMASFFRDVLWNQVEGLTRQDELAAGRDEVRRARHSPVEYESSTGSIPQNLTVIRSGPFPALQGVCTLLTISRIPNEFLGHYEFWGKN